MELLKHLSDKFTIWLLRSTSGFGRQLTKDGQDEQRAWREQRLRNLKGLTLTSQQRQNRAPAEPARGGSDEHRPAESSKPQTRGSNGEALRRDLEAALE
jgi:hypothetical protein